MLARTICCHRLLSRIGKHAATACARPQCQVSVEGIECLLQLGLDVLAVNAN